MPDDASSEQFANPRLAIPAYLAEQWCEQLMRDIDKLATAFADRMVDEPTGLGCEATVAHRALSTTALTAMTTVLHTLASTSAVDLEVPKAIGRLGAAHQLPAATVGRAFRLGAIMLWEAMVGYVADDADAGSKLLAASPSLWAAVDDCVRAISLVYPSASVTLISDYSPAHRKAHEALLDCHTTTEAEIVECAAILRFPHHGQFVVAAAADAGVIGIADLVGELDSHGVRSSWILRSDGLSGILSLPNGCALNTTCALIGARLAGGVGISSIYERLAATPIAHRQARTAGSATYPTENAVVRYDRPSIGVLLAAAPEVTAEIQLTVLGPILELAPPMRDVFLKTLRCWFDVAGDTRIAAERLFCHPNTVRYRLNRVAELTGYSTAAPIDAGQILVALEAYRISGQWRAQRSTTAYRFRITETASTDHSVFSPSPRAGRDRRLDISGPGSRND